MDQLKSFNPESLAELVELERDGSPGLIADLVGDYVAQSGPYLQSIDESAQSGNFPTLERAAHSLKSSSRILGLEITGWFCEKIEVAARGKSIDAGSISSLKSEIEGAIAQLRAFKP